jgi:hypothetical protein
MNLKRRDRIEAAIAVLIVAAAITLAAIYVIGRFLLDKILGIF